jgi:oxygen-independent coproporphyrinogen III oxidase
MTTLPSEMQICEDPISAYVHIPFCHHHCGYCNFTLIAGRNELIESYLDALDLDLQSLVVPRRIKTLFIGGGTPSLLNCDQTERLLRLLQTWFIGAQLVEYSMEVNPNDVTEEKISLWQSFGINRVSVGGQSFQTSKLQRLERTHSPQQLIDAVSLLGKGNLRVAVDLIFGVPEETLAVWRDDLATAKSLNINHLSTYGLTFEKGSRFWGLREKGLVTAVDEEAELAMYQKARRSLVGSGYEHYEVSNFAKGGERCLHNETYWNGGGYWAFGAGAAYYVDHKRGVKHRSTTTYIRRLIKGESPVAEEELLSPEQVLRERFVFGMRKLAGVRWSDLDFSQQPLLEEMLKASVDKHIAAGWMEQQTDRVRLTEAGLWISDSLWRDYL